MFIPLTSLCTVYMHLMDVIYLLFSAFADAAVEPQDFPVAPAYAVPKVRQYFDLHNLCCLYL